MDTLFIALGILVLALLGLLLWFVPHLLQQQAVRVAGETSQLREMLLDLLNEQEAVTLRQTQLGGSLAYLRDHLEAIAKDGIPVVANPQLDLELRTVEGQMSDIQRQLQTWASVYTSASSRQHTQDNESWAYLTSLLAAIQERMGDLTHERAAKHVTTQASQMLQELEQEMHNLQSISEDIERMQWRLRKSLNEREGSVATLRTHMNGVS